MTATIRYRGKTYGEADALALMQALARDGRHVTLQAVPTESGVAWRAELRGQCGRWNATPWAALCAAVRDAGLEDKPPKGPADAAR